MKTEVSLSPEVDNYVKFFDCPVLVHRDEVGDELVRTYENGDLVLMERPWLNCDMKFLHSLMPMNPDDKGVKKAKSRTLLAPLDAKSFSTHLLGRCFPGDLPRARKFQDIVRSVTSQIHAWVRYAFPGYKIVDDQGFTWRFTPSEKEGIHYDSYGVNPEELSAVRLFVNLDTEPRVWRTTHKVDTFIDKYGEQIGLRSFVGTHPNILNAKINNLLPKDLPYHEIKFAPGATWLVNSQTVGHEIFYGNKMLAYTYKVDPTTLRNPEGDFLTRSRRAMARLVDRRPK